MQLTIQLQEDDGDLLPYYARVIEVPVEELEGLTNLQQATKLSEFLYAKLRAQAVGIKAKEAGLEARQAVIDTYGGEGVES